MIERINFGKLKDIIEPPDLIDLQTKSYRDFLQMDVAPTKRKTIGLQAVFRKSFRSRAMTTGSCSISSATISPRPRSRPISA